MPPLFHFNYNNDRHQNIFISTPIILLILLLLIRGRMFSFVEDLEEKEAKINLEKDEAGELKGDIKLEKVMIEEKEVEQQQESEEKSHSTSSQKQQVPESSTKSSSEASLESPIESTSAQPEVSSSSSTASPTISPTASPTTLATQPEEDSTQQHPHSKRNYASKECGAKVLYSNEEAENKGAILNDPERDDYMRNPCERAQNKFLIIELCEIIQLNSFEIANFELFSSNPKDFRLWGSERYPTQEWILIGDFEAQNIRKLQSFDVKQQNTLYIRFVKLELLTHYGNEHFCTLSTFVVYGTSIIEEYEAEVASSSTIQQQQFIPQIDENLNKKEEINSTNVTTINETIKECSKIQEENEQQKIPKNGLKKEEDEINFTAKNVTNEKNKEEKLEKAEATGGGNMLKTIVEQLGSNIKNVIGQAFSKNNNGNEEEKNKKDVFNRRKNVLRYTFTSCQQCFSTKHASTLNYLTLFCWAFFPNIYRIIKHKQQYLFESTKKFNGANKFQNYFLDKVLRRQTSSFCPLPSLPLTCSNRKSETNNVVGQQKQQQNKQQLNSNVVENVVENVGVKLQQQQQKVTPTLVDEKVSRPLPGTSTNSKESIFMKLNKRISLLEQNFSISNEHLNELNKKMTKTEEFVAKQEKITRTTSESVAKHEQKINELQKELRRLSQQLNSVATSIQPTTIRPDGNGFYPPPHFQRYMNNEKQSQCNGKTCMSDFRSSSYISPTYYSQLRNAIGYGREDEVNVRQEGLWTTNEVIVLVVIVQIATLILLKIIYSIINCLNNIRHR
uniref:SUN domain-containing protein n=1 Tax=Meloidogyne incognita TaxID=6306 RepID=A0A914KKB4_MELIC